MLEKQERELEKQNVVVVMQTPSGEQLRPQSSPEGVEKARTDGKIIEPEHHKVRIAEKHVLKMIR